MSQFHIVPLGKGSLVHSPQAKPDHLQIYIKQAKAAALHIKMMVQKTIKQR